MSSYVAYKFNTKLNLLLYHNLFSFAFDKDPKLVGLYTENYSKNMLSMVEQFKKLAFSKDIYKIYREKLVQFRPNEKYDEKSLI